MSVSGINSAAALYKYVSQGGSAGGTTFAEALSAAEQSAKSDEEILLRKYTVTSSGKILRRNRRKRTFGKHVRSVRRFWTNIFQEKSFSVKRLKSLL